MSRVLRITRTLPLAAGPSRLAALRAPILASRSMSTTKPPPLPPTTTPSPPNHDPAARPPNLTRDNFNEPLAYSVSYLGRILRYLAYTAISFGVAGLLGFEGYHLYIEKVALAAPSRAHEDDTFAWPDENQAWTGGYSGGTDPRLGFSARHGLRAAYTLWQYGAADHSSIQKDRGVHPAHMGRRGMIGGTGGLRQLDRGYELAEEYLDATIMAAEKKGIVFPPELDVSLPPGPPSVQKIGGGEVPMNMDPTARDLLLLKAGLLERLNTTDTLEQAREVYERVLRAEPISTSHTAHPVEMARIMRLAHKLGDLAGRAGDAKEAQVWYAWGLERAGIDLPAVKAGKKAPTSGGGSSGGSWWPFGSSSSSSSSKKTATPVATPETPAEVLAAPHTHTDLAPPVLRAALSILISASGADAQHGALDAASAVQTLALTLLPEPARLGTPTATLDGAASLQAAWLESRAALLSLHMASVAYARESANAKKPTNTPPSTATLDMSASATERAENVLSQLTPLLPAAYTAKGSPLTQPAERLVRDTLLTGAEAYYTHAALLERSVRPAGAVGGSKEDTVHRLEHAGECYERAMTLASAESGSVDTKSGEEDAVGRGEEWLRYWRGYVRVRDKILDAVEGEGAGVRKAGDKPATASVTVKA